MSTRPTVVLAVDDHPLIRCALREVLCATRSTELIEASDPHEALVLLAQRQDIDLVFLDLHFSMHDGLAYLERLRAAAPQVPVIVYTMSEEHERLADALARGASGIVPKTHSPELLRRATDLVLAGGVYLPPQFARQLAGAEPAAKRAVAEPKAKAAPTAPMSDQQMKILELLVEGMPNKLIARKLGLAPSTVKNQLTGVFETLGVSNRTQAAIAARNLRGALPASYLAST